MKKEIKQAVIDALALEIMEEAQKDGDAVTLEDAQEMAIMEIKARDIKNYTKSDAPRKQSKREHKIDPDKKFLLAMLFNGLDPDEIDGLQVGEKINESEFSFTYSGSSYTVKLIKHRPPKK